MWQRSTRQPHLRIPKGVFLLLVAAPRSHRRKTPHLQLLHHLLYRRLLRLAHLCVAASRGQCRGGSGAVAYSALVFQKISEYLGGILALGTVGAIVAVFGGIAIFGIDGVGFSWCFFILLGHDGE